MNIPIFPLPVKPRLSWPLILLVCFCAACWPVFGWWVARMTDGSDDPLGVVALAVAAVFLWQRRRELAVSRAGVMTALPLVLAQAVLPLPPLLRGVCFVIALALAFDLGRRQPGVLVLLFLSLPLVASLQFFAGYPLRVMAAEISRGLLALGGLATERSGTVLLYHGREVGVDAACSGVRMLWMALATAGFLAARAGLSGRHTAVLTLAAGLLVIVANGVRAAVLFLPEARLVVWPEWTHEGAGLLAFSLTAGALAFLTDRLARQPGPDGRRRSGGTRADAGTSPVTMRRILVVVILTGAAVVAPLSWTAVAAPVMDLPAGAWPTVFEGEAITPVPLSAREARFAAGFPGELAVCRTRSGRTVIFRQVRQATRGLHSSAQCLQASGASVHPEPGARDDLGRTWGTWSVAGAGRIRSVRELITDAAGRTFPDPASWFWPALLGQSPGPWTAITVIE